MPRVTVVMGVSNGAGTVRRAIDSIRDQTFGDWEYVICDDGSTDATWGVLQQAASEDSRIRLLRFEENRGLAAALNLCIDAARGDYLARQDADDVSHPSRLAEQVRVLDEDGNVSVVGTFVALFDDCGNRWGELRHPLAPTVRDWIRGSKVIHATVMMRASDVRSVGKYNIRAVRSEDYDLWLRLVGRGLQIITIPSVLYSVHWDRDDYERRRYSYRMIESKVRWHGYRSLNVSLFAYIYAIKPLLLGLLPHRLIYWYHLSRYKGTSQKTIA